MRDWLLPEIVDTTESVDFGPARSELITALAIGDLAHLPLATCTEAGARRKRQAVMALSLLFGSVWFVERCELRARSTKRVPF